MRNYRMYYAINTVKTFLTFRDTWTEWHTISNDIYNVVFFFVTAGARQARRMCLPPYALFVAWCTCMYGRW